MLVTIYPNGQVQLAPLLENNLLSLASWLPRPLLSVQVEYSPKHTADTTAHSDSHPRKACCLTIGNAVGMQVAAVGHPQLQSLLSCASWKGCSGDESIWCYKGHSSQTKGNSVKMAWSGPQSKWTIPLYSCPDSSSQTLIPSSKSEHPTWGTGTDAHRWNPAKLLTTLTDLRT